MIGNLLSLKDKRVVILGLGKNRQGSGVGAAKWCLRHGMRVLITDLLKRDVIGDTIAEVEKAVAKYRAQGLVVHEPVFVLGEHREKDIVGADLVIQNPDVRFDSPFVKLAESRGIPVETDISLFFQLCPFHITGITGTRGKTTTTLLTGAILKAHFGQAVIAGNLRVSPLEFLDGIVKRKKSLPIVLELSSWQIESLARIKKSPCVAAITNLSADHLNRYGTMEKYAAAKEGLFAFQDPRDIAIFNFDIPATREMSARAAATKKFFSMKPLPKHVFGTFYRGDALVYRDAESEEPILKRSDIKLPGDHSAANVLVAALIARVSGVPAAAIRKAVRAFRGVPDRLETVRVVRGVTFVNDTTATSPEGAIAALDAFKRKRLIVIAGGTDKQLPMDAFAKALAKRAGRLVLFKGTATDKILAALPKKTKPTLVASMREAMDAALAVAKRGDVVLLTPGAASFGIFKNEFDRGDQFVKMVKAL